MNIWKRWIFLVGITVYLLCPQFAYAHAELIGSEPASDSHWDRSPAQVVLTFNERVENELFDLKVRNQNGQSVTNNNPRLSDDHRKLMLDLPSLSDGVYTVSYRVISADGHPVEGSYVFSIGTAQTPQSGANPSLNSPFGQNGLQSTPAILFTLRIIEMLLLLAVSGWTIWSALHRPEVNELLTFRHRWSDMLQSFYLLALIATTGAEIPGLLNNWTAEEFLALLWTGNGISWTACLLLSIIGFVSLQRSKIFDIIWVLLLLIANTFSGHAMSAKIPMVTVLLDTLHLLAASLWVGGLLLIMTQWKKYRDHAIRFLPVFSKYALFSLIVLISTGILYTWILIPRWEALLHTDWGIWLIVKTALVLLVIITAFILRVHINRQKEANSGLWLKIDFSLMLGIVLIAGIFTHLNPVPPNQKLNWHEMGDKYHMTATITPNNPGENTFHVTLWTTEEFGKPKRIQYTLKNLDKPDMAPVEAPIAFVSEQEKPIGSIRWLQYEYEIQGSYLPFPGNWRIEVRIMDSNDDETVYAMEETVY